MKTQLPVCKSIVLLLMLLVSVFPWNVSAQSLTEDFSYTAGQVLATANNWTFANGTGTANNPTVTNGGLSYASHPGSGVGNAVSFTTSGDDIQRAISSAITSGTAYVSVLVNLSSAQTGGDYFFSLSGSTTNFSTRLYAKSTTGGYLLGIEKTGTSPTYDTTTRSFGTTYLIVIKYTYVTGGTTNDTVNLFINPALGGSEGTPTVSAPTAGTDATTITSVTLRQGSASAAAAGTIDAIRVGTTWSSVTAAAATPTVNVSATTTSAFTTTYGTASSAQNFTVSGSNLTANLVATAPTGYEVSKDNSTFSSSVSYAPSSGTVSSSNLYVRLAATTVPGTYNSAAVTISSTSATDKTITTPASGNTVSVKPVTIGGVTANNKVYDRTNAATLNTGSATVVGKIGSDVVTVDSSSATATFASTLVANGITVTATGFALSGTHASYYSLSAQPSGLSANITAKALTISNAQGVDKTYDGTTAATFTGTLNGVIAPDVVNFNGTGTFASSAVGTNIAITSTATLYGADADNYSLTQPTGIKANINSAAAQNQTITFGSLSAKNYGDANFNLTATASSGLAVSYTSSNTAVATVSGNTVTIVGAGSTIITASQAGGDNNGTTYNPAVNVQQTLTINPKTLTLNGAIAANKVYDGTNSATITGTLNGVVGSDDVNYVGNGVFASTNVSNGIAVTPNISLVGAQAGNYALTQPTNLSANITAKPLTASGMTASKTYDRSNAVSISGTTLNGVISPDNVTVSGTGTFNQITVGNNIGVTYSLTLGGAQAGNYTLNTPAAITGTISPAPLTVSGIAIASKTYDANNTATITGTAVLNGVIAGDDVQLGGTPVATFNTISAGSNKAVTVVGYSISGLDSNNYSITQPNNLTATINKANQTITFGAIPNKTTSDAPFNPGATASSGLTVTYSSSNTAVATASGSTITITGIGTSTITASQAGDSNYNAASAQTQTLTVSAAPFTDGRLVVLRVNSTTNAGTISLDEYTPAGAAGTSYALPTTTSGNVNRVTLLGNTATEGQMSLSADGQYLVLGGYDMAVGATSVSGVNRVIARVDYSGNVATTPFASSIHTAFRSVASTNGQSYYTSGSSSGLGYIPHTGSTTTSTNTMIFTGSTNLRSLNIFNGQLYYGTGSAPTGIYSVGTGTPTTTGQTSTLRVSATDPYGYYMVNRGGTNWNCYAVYSTSPGIYKFSSSDDGATWTARGSVSNATAVLGIVAKVNGSNVDVYATTGANLIKLTDTAAFNATITGTISTLATAASGSVFRGLAFAPKLIAPVINNATLTANGSVGTAFSAYTITALNAAASYSATGLPAGLSVNTSNGQITGTPTSAGTFNVTISATNAAGSDSKTLVITIAKGNQTITFGNLTTVDISQTTSFNLTATSATSGINPITFSSSDPNVATISGNTVTLVGTGVCLITASQAANDNYNAASDVSQTLNVIDSSKQNQVITFDPLNPAVYGDASFALTASSSSGLPLSYLSSNPSVATVSGNIITVVGIGNTTITAIQGGNNAFNPANNVAQTLTVLQKALTVSGATVSAKTYDGTNTATITGGTLVGVIGSDVVNLTGNGTFVDVNAGTGIAVTTNLTLNGADAAKYTLIQPLLTGDINPAPQTITMSAFPTKTLLDPDFAPGAFSATSAINPISYSSSNTNVAIITASNLIKVVGEGSTTITASQAYSQNYSAASTSQVLTVAKALYLNQFTGVSNCPTNGNVPVTTTGVTGTAANRSTLTCTATANVFNSTTLNNTATVSNTSYIEFSLSVASGSYMRLTSMSFSRQGSSTAPNQIEVRYSTDNFSTYTSWGAAPVTPTTAAVANWDFADFTSANGGTVNFRIYPYGTTRCDLAANASASGTFRIDDLTVYGLVVTAPTAAVLSGSNTICQGNSAPLTVNITGGNAPYNVVLSNGSSTQMANNYISGSNLTVTPGSSATYTIQSITDSYGLQASGLSGSATVTVNTNVTYYQDTDSDTYGNPAVAQVSCFGAPSGYVLNSQDCNDNNININPSVAEICGNGIDDNCDGRIDEVCSTQVQASQCGVTLSSLSDLITVDPVSVAQAYRFEISDGTNTYIIENTVNSFRFSSNSLIRVAATYSVRVAIKYQGNWQGYYGNTCQISSPNINLLQGYCGLTLADLNYSKIYCTPASNVIAYRFEVNDGNSVRTYDSSTNSMNLIDLPGGITYSTTYSIRIAPVYNNGVGRFGNTCAVYTSAKPSVKVINSICGTTLAHIENTIFSTTTSNATGYKFEVTANGNTQVIETAANRLTLTNLVGGAAYDTTYSIRVSALVDGTYWDYGNSCTVTTPSAITQIGNPSCGSTLVNLFQQIYANSLRYVTSYRFEVTDNNSVRYFTSNTNSFNLMQLSGGAYYGTTFAIRVAAFYNGSWQAYGPSCNLTTPGISSPTTSLASSYCGTTLSSFWTSLFCNQVPYAVGYSFQVTWGASNIATITNSANRFNLMQLQGGAAAGTTYTVRVAPIFPTGTGTYGSPCVVTTGTSRRNGEGPSSVFAASAYPNPYSNSFAIALDTASDENVSVLAYDMMGKLIYQANFTPTQLTESNLGTDWASGVYQVFVQQADNNQLVRVVKR